MTEQMQNDLLLSIFFVGPFVAACVVIAAVMLWDDWNRHRRWKPVEKPPLGGVTISKLWKEDVADLRRILLLYGDHRVMCCTGYDRPVSHPEEDCNCGWREIYTDMDLYGLNAPAPNSGHYPL